MKVDGGTKVYLYGMNDLRRNAQPPRKKKSQGFASGMIIGAVSAFMAVILLILSVAAVCIAKGYIHIGVNGDVYIQSDAVTDSDGIGSEVEGKLNAIDSVLNHLLNFGYEPEHYLDMLENQDRVRSIKFIMMNR